ncbi:MAG: hypothetical protein AW09_004150 [Candidatus Accumulibacter phosphatis]|uniref:Uncharacterized protein n=1 Tax=Candidatus Accumulibacter phosphatis TaxID=327160 RepID=A0A080LRE5_9PROT|nr:MAG: hypothetical protein AW09_004150 [Candidatus Accumulibacter phosphatis]
MGADATAIHVCQTGGSKDAAPCQSHRVEVDVGGEDLQSVLIEGSSQTFGKQDGQRIRFLAGGAARGPDADVVTGLFVGENVANHLVEAGKGIAVPKEGGDRDQDVLAQPVEFDRRVVDHLQVIL